ncbi:exodeoxyribonuclease V subunit alpha [Isoalcanivorax beigongshangi]|uniref:RecBCD enzyme subunit RecD n=1 Tax=Isoalcanivorax beigongshangi TaxID=3238810 RepID=A0ABV4AD65_9GAMM
MTALAWIEERARSGRLRPLDAALAQLVAAHTDADDERVWWMLAVSHQSGQGHVCLDLPAAQRLFDDDCPWPRPQALPDPDGDIVGIPGDTALLIRDGERLYLARDWQAEAQVLWAIRARLPWRTLPGGVLAQHAAALFPAGHGDGLDWQKVAAMHGVLRPFAVITGGPGTGKTWTVARLLALRLLTARALDPHASLPRIRLAAPTGKAAARLTESLQASLAELALPEDIRAALPSEAVTLHRLLGIGRDGRPRHNAQHPLLVDQVVVDEASMVDLGLMTQLLRALPADAGVCLVGDRDQLASVEAGAVLADLCRLATGAYSPDYAARLAAEGLPVPAAAQRPEQDLVVRLTRVHRFGERSGIAELATALREQDDTALAALRQAPPADLGWLPAQRPEVLQQALAALRPVVQVAAEGADPAAVLAAFGRFRVLCALRRGPWGVEQFNQELVRALRQGGLAAGEWYPGRAVLLTRNDWALGLFNGDAGITVRDPADGSLKVAFATLDGAVRLVAPVRLPSHEEAWAMTIHKSQGSEFEQVLVVLPDQDSPLLTRELLYTAVTRARRRLQVAGPAGLLAQAARREVQRQSGLAERLLRD